MAPRKVKTKPKVAGTRKSKRLSEHAVALDSSSDSFLESVSSTEELETPQLNDDCLLEIFAHVPMNDLLYDVASCSRTFRALAEVAAQKKCRKEQITYNFSNDRDTAIMSHFGIYVRNLFVFQGYGQNKKFDSLSWLKHCAALKTLTIQNMHLLYDSECFATFGKLEHLTLDRCFGSMQQYEHILTACKNLKTIKLLSWTQDVSDEMLAHLAKLKDIERMTSHHDVSRCRHTIQNLAMIAQLKKLKFLCFNIGSREPYASYIDSLSGSQSLEELVFFVNFVDGSIAEALEKFPLLKSCTIKHECWVERKTVRSTMDHLRSAIAVLRSNIRTFDVTEDISTFVESKTHSHIKLCVIITRSS